MPLPFDATLKDLVASHADDWLAMMDETVVGPVQVLTPDLSTVTAFTDIVLHLGDSLRHLDFQSGPDSALPRRILLYNALLFDAYDLPVHSVVILLRPRANRGDLTGTVSYAPRPGRGKLEFGFEVLPVWKVPVEHLLSSGLGTLPLAVLGQMPVGQTLEEALPGVIDRLVRRIETEASAEEGPILLTASYVLMGLRLSRERAVELFQGVRKMRDSTTYQAILDEGRAEGELRGRAEGELRGRAEGELRGRAEGELRGRAEEARQLLLRLGRKRLGKPKQKVIDAIHSLNDVNRLEFLIERLLEVSSWQELLQTP